MTGKIKVRGVWREVQYRTSTELFDAAEAVGARLVVDQLGERFLCLEGDWYGMPQPARCATEPEP